jgi:hypothetical protein
MHDQEWMECLYCNKLIDADLESDVPAVDDDDAWQALAREHDVDCEWIETRAHRRTANNTGTK